MSKNKVPCRSIENRNCISENTDIAKIPSDQWDGEGVKIYSNP